MKNTYGGLILRKTNQDEWLHALRKIGFRETYFITFFFQHLPE